MKYTQKKHNVFFTIKTTQHTNPYEPNQTMNINREELQFLINKTHTHSRRKQYTCTTQSRINTMNLFTHTHARIKNDKKNRHTNIVSVYLFLCWLCARISHMTVIKSKGCVIRYPFQPCCQSCACGCDCFCVGCGHQSNIRGMSHLSIASPLQQVFVRGVV